PLDFNYVISGPVAKEQGGQYPWYGDFWLLVNGQLSTDPLEYDYPIQGQRWFATRAAANVNNGEEIFYNVGTLVNQQGKQYGYYGNSAFNMTIGDFNAQNSPAQWDPSKFRASTDLNSSYNDYLNIDADDQGRRHAGLFRAKNA
nr:hypothetical protein [Cyclobacteriaceae bacterium]